VTRWTVALLAVVALGGILAVGVARALGFSGSRASLLVSVVSQWLAAWVLWGLAGHLAVRSGLLAVYEPAFFVALGVPAAIWHYRAIRGFGGERGRAIFVGAQLLWLVIVLALNGAFSR
jgi:hypothetical protein